MILLAEADGASPLPNLLFFAVLLVGLYLLLIRPQRARARHLGQVRAALAVGTRVMTSAGLIATVASIDDDGTVLLEIAPGVQARFAAEAVVRILDGPATSEGDA